VQTSLLIPIIFFLSLWNFIYAISFIKEKSIKPKNIIHLFIIILVPGYIFVWMIVKLLKKLEPIEVIKKVIMDIKKNGKKRKK